MKITKNGQIPSMKGPEDWFTGSVIVDGLYMPEEKTVGAGSLVTFSPRARTAWHTHPAGQTLIVQSGLGLVQREGGPIEEIRPGDIVYFEPGEKHWHGASANKAMSHIAIQEAVEGSVVTWMEHVTDEQYSKEV